jgi:hypothetical protein
MGSLKRAAVVAFIVFIGTGVQPTGTDNGDEVSLQMTGLSDFTVRAELRHPASRKTVSGPWPRFAKEMLA